MSLLFLSDILDNLYMLAYDTAKATESIMYVLRDPNGPIILKHLISLKYMCQMRMLGRSKTTTP